MECNKEEYEAFEAMLEIGGDSEQLSDKDGSSTTVAEELTVQPPKAHYSAIPVATMVELMEKYGPERCLTRRSKKQPTNDSIRRKFVRWFPNFFWRFRYDVRSGTYVPAIGERQEQLRRRYLRHCASRGGRKKPKKCTPPKVES